MAARALPCVPLLLSIVQAIIPWDCDNYGLPMQMLKGSNDNHYRLVELDIVANEYNQLCAPHPSRSHYEPHAAVLCDGRSLPTPFPGRSVH